MKKVLKKMDWKDKHQINNSGCFYEDDTWKGQVGECVFICNTLFSLKNYKGT